VNDPATWGTFESAKKRFNEGDVDGFGFVFTENDPYVGIDLDNCRDKKTGTITDRAQKIISSFASYTELSPSGTGVHIIAKGVLPGKGKKDGNIEMYDQGRYFTFTGETI
jgi:primase-polymerase (primpol)-like protein